MKTFRRNILFIFVMAALLAGCRAEQASAPCPDYGVSTPIEGLPDYLSKVWPYPDSEVTLQCYEETLTDQQNTPVIGRGVGANILVYRIDTSLTSNDPPDDDRVHLYIDDKLASEKSLIITDWLVELVYLDEQGNETPSSKSTKYSLSWAPELSPGLHEARIEITRDNGELLEYEWSFTITNP